MNHASECGRTIGLFSDFFSAQGYEKLEPVGIASKVDRSVYLANSATNLFKPYFSKENVRICAAQPSMRTQALKDFYNAEAEAEYPTFFTSLGAYVSVNLVEKIFKDTFHYLALLGFAPSAMRIRVSKEDVFLIEILKKFINEPILQTDDRCERYTHSYGRNLTGRAVKIDCFQNTLGRYKNICYLIAIYKDGVLCGVEFASSEQQILLRCNELKFGVSLSAIADFLPTETFCQRRLADSVAAVSNLIFEGIKPNSSNTNGRTLKKYLNAVSYYGRQENVSSEEVIDCIFRYVVCTRGEYSDEFRSNVAQYLEKYY